MSDRALQRLEPSHERILLSLAALGSLAAAMPAMTAAANAQPVGQREVNQQSRIDQGVRSGQLTYRGDRRLEHREYRLNAREDRMRYRDGGRLTHYDRVALQRQENRDSRAIYRLKHNPRVTD
jgi:Ni/Co efflux regulator RcnB